MTDMVGPQPSTLYLLPSSGYLQSDPFAQAPPLQIRSKNIGFHLNNNPRDYNYDFRVSF